MKAQERQEDESSGWNQSQVVTLWRAQEMGLCGWLRWVLDGQQTAWHMPTFIGGSYLFMISFFPHRSSGLVRAEALLEDVRAQMI